MIGKIIAGYRAALTSLFRFLVLLAACMGLGFLIVYPLWRLADTNPSLYTLVFSLLFFSLLAFILSGRIRLAFSRNPSGFLHGLARKAVLAGGLAASVLLVLEWKRALAALVLLATLALYGFLAFGLSPGARRKTR